MFDCQNVGKQGSWQDPEVLGRQGPVPIRVPSCWEETESDYEGVAWYARRFTVPESWKGRHVRLRFDAVNYLAEVWLNHEVVGDHEGGYTPFDFDVTELVDCGGENVLVVRVVGPAIRATPENVYSDRGTRLTVTAVNDGPALEGELAVSASHPTDGEVWATKIPVSVEPGVQRLLDQGLNTDKLRGMVTIKATLKGRTKLRAQVGAINDYEILVVGAEELTPSLPRVTVIEPKDQLRKFCRGCGIEYHAFQDGGAVNGPIVVAQPDAWTEKQLARFVHLIDWIERGGVAVWLKVPSTYEWHGQPIYRDYEKNYLMRLQRPEQPRWDWPNWLISSGVFPLELRHRTARGMWIPVLHYVRPHPIFEGLPHESFMNQPYHNVAPRNTLVNLPGATVAGSVSWDVEHDCYAKMQAWHGIDLAVVPHGQGKMILSMLQIVDHLGTDPVTDKLLQNLLAYASEISGDVESPSPGLTEKIKKRQSRYRRLRSEEAAKGSD